MTALATGCAASSPEHPGVRNGATAERGAAGTVRVSLREIRDVAFRAVLAAGASSGEAAAAAALVVLGEVVDGAGVRALVDELGRIPRGRIPVSREGAALDVLHDPAHRGPLLLGPLAADLAVAGGRPVLLAGATWTPATEWILVNSAAHAGIPLLAARIGAHGGPDASVLAAPDGALYRATDAAEGGPHLPLSPDSPVPHVQGTLLSGWTAETLPADLVPIRSSAQHDKHFATATRNGLCVDPEPWSRACAASRRFLVPEPTELPAR